MENIKENAKKNDNFFTPIINTKPYLKAAFEGFAGSGKTYTAALVAVGLHKRIKSKKPVIIFDTERAAKFLKPLFAEKGIEVLLRESRSLADLKETMRRMRVDGISDVLIIDSISHVWEHFLEDFKRKVNRKGLQFQDWGIIKPLWKTEFSDPFVNDPYNVVMTGRAGYEYESEINEETNKREIFKSGIKMKVEGETAYEPDLLVLMERFEEVMGKDKKVWREATVIKDRSTIIDGQTFKNPGYENFAPAVEAMLAEPSKLKPTPEGDTTLLIETEQDKTFQRRDRNRWLEEIDGLLLRVWPGNVGKDKQAKLDALADVFDTTSEIELGRLSPDEARAGYLKLADYIVKVGRGRWDKTEDGRKKLVIQFLEKKE